MKKIGKKAVAAAAALVLSIGLGLFAQTASAVTVSSSRWQLKSSDTMLYHGTTYVSLRAFSEAMGASQVLWEDGAAQVYANGWTLWAKPGEQYLTANGRYYYIPNEVLLRNGRTMVPVRAIAAAYGAKVDWKPGRVTITEGSGSSVPGHAYYDTDSVYWLSRIISSESRGEPLDGQIAVGNVVMNRVASSQFPNTIYGVIFDQQHGVQFEPVSNGSIHQEPTAMSVIAAKLVLEGANTGRQALYFFAPELSQGTWIANNRTYSHTIGCHRFYL